MFGLKGDKKKYFQKLNKSISYLKWFATFAAEMWQSGRMR